MAQLRTPKVYGLHWAGDFARTRGAATGDPSRVTSTVTLVKGDWPAPGTPVGVHSFASPQGLEAPRTAVSFPGPGPLTAEFQPDLTGAPGGHGTWAVLVHGKGAEPDEFDRVMPVFERAGIPALAVHYRGDPGMPPGPDGRYGFGASEWADLAAAVDYARSRGAQHVVLVGASMGERSSPPTCGTPPPTGSSRG